MPQFSVRIAINGRRFGELHAGRENNFNFAQIIHHLARTRALCAGSIVGAGTISNEDPATGSACITEARVRQILAGVEESRLHPYLAHGDRVHIEALDDVGSSLFGCIDQSVTIEAAQFLDSY